MSWYDPDREDTTIYKVVVNHEEQYSIWPADRENPLGWRDAGKTGPKAECLEFVKEVWTDMRPLSLRKKMEEDARRRAENPEPEPEASADDEPDDLVDRLAREQHPVEVGLRPDKTVEAFQECLNRGYVHIKFTGTRGGTELGVRLDTNACKLTEADFASGQGPVHLEGNLRLNYVDVRCIADIDLKSLSGSGRLERVAAQ
jgi:uncharacterized protein YbdZ (MbtH family)